jgi:acyl-CoA reductase-like NAD-dependent aldehyde dehydrogenase
VERSGRNSSQRKRLPCLSISGPTQVSRRTCAIWPLGSRLKTLRRNFRTWSYCFRSVRGSISSISRRYRPVCPLNVGLYVKPTILSEVRTGMRIAQEEIFGPVLCLIPYDTVEEAVTIANDTVYGLGAHVQGKDMDVVRDVASQIRSGQVHLNYPAWDPHAPFGGFKQSGNGREYGIEGMLEYLEVKSILGYF